MKLRARACVGQGGLFSHTELCRRHNISRRTGYKWLERYEAEGPDGLLDRSHSGLTRRMVSDLPASGLRAFDSAAAAKLHLPDYPAHFETRKVSTNDGIRWHSAWVNVSHLLGGELGRYIRGD